MEHAKELYLRPAKVAEYFEVGCIGYLFAEGYKPKAKLNIALNSNLNDSATEHSFIEGLDSQELFEFSELEEPDLSDELDESTRRTSLGNFMQDTLLAKMRAKGLILVESDKVITSYDELYDLIDNALADKIDGSQVYLNDISFDFHLSEQTEDGYEAKWTVFRPDLIRVTKKNAHNYHMEVIDIKASKRIRIEHKMQVAIYVDLLSSMLYMENTRLNELAGNHDDCQLVKLTIDTDNGYIQLAQDDSWETSEGFQVGEAIDLSAPMDVLCNFQFLELENILRIYNENLDSELPGFQKYIFSPACQHCSKKEECFNRAFLDADIRLLPSITTHAQREWIELGLKTSLLKADHSLLSFEEFAMVYEDQKEILACNPFWEATIKGNPALWRKSYEAFTSKLMDPQKISEVVDWELLRNGNRASMVIPAQCDVSIFMSLKTSSNAWGERFISGFDLMTKIQNQTEITDKWGKKERRYTVDVAPNNCSEEFICTLYNIFSKLFEIAKDVAFQLSIFTASNKEKSFLYNTLFSALESGNEDIASKANTLLFYFQSANYINSDIHPAKLTPSPIVSLLEEISYLYAIPSIMGIHTNDVLRAFGFDMATLALPRVEQLECIVHTMQQQDAMRLCAPFWRFRRPFTNGIRNKYLSKMHFIQLNEKRLNDQEYYRILMASTDEIIESCNGIYLFEPNSCVMDDQIVLFRGEAFDTINQQMFMSSDFTHFTENYFERDLGNWIVIPNTIENLYALRKHILRGYQVPTSGLILVQDDEGNGYYKLTKSGNLGANGQYISFDFEEHMILNDIDKTISSMEQTTGFIALRPMPEDFTTANMLEDIVNIDKTCPVDETEISWCPKYDNCPDGNMDETKIRYDYGKLVSEDKETYFTDSQFEAFKQFYNHNITLLQGPPGTGKTDFIARTLIAMARMHREKIKSQKGTAPLRVCISANSHAAINNVLNKVFEYLDGPYIKLIKCRNSGEETIHVSATFANRRSYTQETFLTENSQSGIAMIIVGGTNWFFGGLTRHNVEEHFDYIIVDESSQMNSYQALHLFANAHKNTKYMIVGDPLQLPSILRGQYENKDNQIKITSSVYDLFDSLPERDSYHRIIVEDFRMNRVLLDYITNLYEGYKPYNNDIEERSLTGWDYLGDEEQYDYLYRYEMSSLRRLTDIFKVIIDGEQPLVVCHISGDNALQKQTCEVELVKRITQVFYQIYGDDLSEKYGVVIPYHRHIDAVKKALRGDNEQTDEFESGIIISNTLEDIPSYVMDELVIDTVDKLQGQEKDVIVCSYGIAEKEHILNEAEFVYSLNRLNVSLTRARKKCIIILSDTLTSRPIEYLNLKEEDSLTKGIDFLCGLIDYAQGLDGYEAPHTFYPTQGNLCGAHIECYSKSFYNVCESEHWW